MTPENLEENIQNIVIRLVKCAEEHCWNRISDNLTFIISDCNEFGENFRERRKLRNKINRYKRPLPLKDAIEILKKEYRDLYDINLYIFKALAKETIVEIRYYRKSNMNEDYYERIKDDPPMLHAKITHPVYFSEGDRFDINWESGGGLRHYWNCFLYEFKYRKMIRKHKK